MSNVQSGKVATVSNGGTDNVSLIVQYTDSHASNQSWRIIDVNHNSQTLAMQAGVVELKGVQSGRCVQVSGSPQDAKLDGRGSELWDCVHGVKQRWELIDRSGHKYALKNANSGKYLDVDGFSDAEGTALAQYSCHFDTNQQWVFVAGRNGAVKLQSALTGGVATARASGSSSGVPVQQFSDGNGDEQQWLVTTTPAA
jgi:hypothetical protein